MKKDETVMIVLLVFLLAGGAWRLGRLLRAIWSIVPSNNDDMIFF